MQNIHTVKDKSIRTLSHECYVSTTTMIRFVRKLGFSGYSDFINLLRLTDFSAAAPQTPQWDSRNEYLTGYVDMIVQTLRIVSEDISPVSTNILRVRRASSCFRMSSAGKPPVMRCGFLPPLGFWFSPPRSLTSFAARFGRSPGTTC